MNRKGAKPAIFALVLMLVLGGGLIRLVWLRFEKGDSYPEYSTFRSDALGCRALYEALRSLSGLEVRRFIRPAETLSNPGQTTMFWLGAAPSSSWSDASYSEWRPPKRWLDFVRSGGHLVWSFREEANFYAPVFSDSRKADRAENPGEDSESGLGLQYRRAFGEAEAFEEGRMARVSDEEGLRVESLPRFSRGGFVVAADSEWRIVFEMDGVPKVVRRPWGEGFLTVLSDTYVLSNEALLEEPSPEFVRWLLMGRREVWFDETHLGIRSQASMVALMRRYRLLPLYVSLILIGLLVVWRSSANLLPKSNQISEAEAFVDSGRLAASSLAIGGISGLLRRHVPAPDLLPICAERWQRSMRRSSGGVLRFEAEIQQIASKARHRSLSPVEAYQKASDLLRRPQIGKFKETA